MRRSIKIFSGLIFLIGFVGIAVAATSPDPLQMMNTVSDKMLTALKENRAKLKQDPELIYKLVDKIVVPHVDVDGMSRSVLGRNTWNSASVGQQKEFIKAFQRVVISTYSSALNAYSDETIKFFPLRESYQGKTRIQINSQIIRSDGPPIAVSYRLALLNNDWKIYDLNVEGVSLLQSFNAQFAEQVSQGKNIVQITQNLNQRKLKTSRDSQ